jgi:hypothetical protein
MLEQYDGDEKRDHRHDWNTEQQLPIVAERLPEDRILGYQFVVLQPKRLNPAGSILQETGVDILYDWENENQDDQERCRSKIEIGLNLAERGFRLLYFLGHKWPVLGNTGSPGGIWESRKCTRRLLLPVLPVG